MRSGDVFWGTLPYNVCGASVAFKVNFVNFACYASHHYPKTILGIKTFQPILHSILVLT